MRGPIVAHPRKKSPGFDRRWYHSPPGRRDYPTIQVSEAPVDYVNGHQHRVSAAVDEGRGGE